MVKMTPYIETISKSAKNPEQAGRVLQSLLESRIPVYENEELLMELANIDFMDEIPNEIYEAAANVIAYIQSMDAPIGMDSPNFN